MPRISVVKLGGSLALAVQLAAWLEAIEAGAGRVVMVCGGGPFADAVRGAQRRMGFDDEAADLMALIAMEQYGIALAALSKGFVLADSRSAISAALRAKRVPIWAPRRMVRATPDIPTSWDVTSDSLAAWLAGELDAMRLLLIKRARPAAGSLTAEALSEDGVVDAAFPRFLAASGVPCALIGPRHRRLLAEALRSGGDIGRKVSAGPSASEAKTRRSPAADFRRHPRRLARHAC
jgi:5-(aminomethyl)-3-furanmethanol phosphate kinase